MNEFIELTNDGKFFTNKMPQDESVVEVRMTDGSIVKSYYACNIMDLGDFDFLQVDENDEPLIDADSIASDVAAWRPVS